MLKNTKGIPVVGDNYAALMHRAAIHRRLETDPVRAEWWAGYVRGLRRVHHGERYGSESEHDERVLAANARDPMRAAMGRGYCAGLALMPDEPEYAAQLPGKPMRKPGRASPCHSRPSGGPEPIGRAPAAA